MASNILEFNQYQKFDKAPFIIYADLECIKEKIHECKNNLENSSITKVIKHIPSGFSMSKIYSFRSIENKNDVYRCKYSIKKFCQYLREHAMKIINFKKKKLKLLAKEQQESYENAKLYITIYMLYYINRYISKEKLENKYLKDKRYRTVRDHCHCHMEVLQIAYVV